MSLELFVIAEDGLVDLNKIWIQLIPEFKKVYARDKGSEGDYDGRKKLKARKEFTYIYFHSSFLSPLLDYDEEEKHIESLRYAMLERVDDAVLQADMEYKRITIKGTRSLRTYKSLLKTLDAYDDYFETLDFTKTDKRSGMLVNNPDSVGKSIERLNKVYDAVENFKKRVDVEMRTGGMGIRGSAELGDNEATDASVNVLNKRGEWSEADIQDKSEDEKEKTIKVEVAGRATFAQLAGIVQKANIKKDITEEELAAIPEEDEEK